MKTLKKEKITSPRVTVYTFFCRPKVDVNSDHPYLGLPSKFWKRHHCQNLLINSNQFTTAQNLQVLCVPLVVCKNIHLLHTVIAHVSW